MSGLPSEPRQVRYEMFVEKSRRELKFEQKLKLKLKLKFELAVDSKMK